MDYKILRLSGTLDDMPERLNQDAWFHDIVADQWYYYRASAGIWQLCMSGVKSVGPFREDDFTLKEDIQTFGQKASNTIDELYKEGEALGYNYRDICYVLSYLVHANSRMKLYHEEVENL